MKKVLTIRLDLKKPRNRMVVSARARHAGAMGDKRTKREGQCLHSDLSDGYCNDCGQPVMEALDE